jgi:TIR domain-containing protein
VRNQTRRLFICYPRSALKPVVRFETALRESLGVRGRTYEVFRDKGEADRIEPGQVWEDVLQAKLQTSVCCIVVMVPAIFESKECTKEIEKFRSYAEGDPRRFFFPIDFVNVASTVEAFVKKGDETARLMQQLDRHDFTKAVHEPNQTVYDKHVDDIAENIHRRIEGGDRTPTKPPAAVQLAAPVRFVETESGPTEPESLSEPWTRHPIVIASLAVAAALIAALVWSKPWSKLEVGPATEREFEAVLPVRLRTSPSASASEAAESLAPGIFKGGGGTIRAIRPVMRTTWYEIEFTSNVKRYLDGNSVPAWTDVVENIDNFKELAARKLPLMSESADQKLAPDSMSRTRRQYGPARTGTIEGTLWYRIRTSLTSDVYVPGQQGSEALAIWMEYQGCLQAKHTLVVLSAIVNGGRKETLVRSQQVPGRLQSADVQGEKWIRLLHRDFSFGYLRSADLEPCG